MAWNHSSVALPLLCHFGEVISILSDQSHTPRENLRRHFGLVLRNAEHVDSRSSQEARTIGRVGGMWLGANQKNDGAKRSIQNE